MFSVVHSWNYHFPNCGMLLVLPFLDPCLTPESWREGFYACDLNIRVELCITVLAYSVLVSCASHKQTETRASQGLP